MEKFSVARVRMDRERYERVQAYAGAQGESVNAFINRAIDQTMAQDCGKGPAEAAQSLLGDGVVSIEEVQETAHSGTPAKEEP